MTEQMGARGDARVSLELVLPSGKEKRVVASVVGRRAMFEGDIVLATVTKERVENGTEYRAVAVSDAGRLWPGASVAFSIEGALPSQERVRDAIRHWESSTAIRFVERTPDRARELRDWVSFEEHDGCWSSVGRAGGKQVLSVGAEGTTGNVIHEIGHVVGLWHEQSREDRAQHVEILQRNIDPGNLHNFDQHILDADDVGAYDFGSIMHYGPKAFSVNGEDTIRPKEPLPAGVELGQRRALSAGDIAAVNRIYGPVLRDG